MGMAEAEEEVTTPKEKCRAMPGIEPGLHQPGCEHEISDDDWEGYLDAAEADEWEDVDCRFCVDSDEYPE